MPQNFAHIWYTYSQYCTYNFLKNNELLGGKINGDNMACYIKIQKQ